jgi:putative ABC transport system permease protein
MNPIEGIRIALSALWANKLRSFLVMLGNVIAVASIIAVVSIVDGMNVYMHDKVFEQGSGTVNLVDVDPMKLLTDRDALLKSIHNPPILLEDRDFLRDRLPSASYIGASKGRRRSVTLGEKRLTNVPIRGKTAEYPFLENIELDAGRHFTTFEENRSRTVAVVGKGIAEELFPGADPLGKTVKVAGRPFTIIGLAAEKGRLLGEDQDTFVIIPITAFFKIFGRPGRANSVTITIKAVTTEAVPQLMDEITAAMRVRHRLRPGERNDFDLQTSDAMIGLWVKIKNMLLGVLMMIVGISAVVAGIVIMNIMLVSVQERTREIGIRKAIGAKAADILWQFLVEALTLSIIGGIIGILMGYGLAAIIASASPLPYAAKVWSVILGLLLTVVVGVFFGIFPARKAAKLDPVEALRYE